MKLVVGLGNPGNEYKKTRHNVGFMVLDSYLGEVHWSNKFKGLYYEKNVNGEKYVFLKPQTYMNLSGISVSSFVKFYKLTFKDVLIIHDDLDLPVGKFRIKINSSSGGHNGIKDIIASLHTDAFARVKIGISQDTNKDTKDYVLGNFSKEELTKIENNFNSIFDIIENFDYEDITNLMSKYN
ncbi:MAG: aminoacyl-tRNA hydrolase [Bacilli bacterium]|jgi:PTH1 family peptidyl-tRNA hydrolase|nr:aminoacyl-tRNA hydrolase [Bacilli bacterium]